MNKLLNSIRICTHCSDLPFGPRPIVQASYQSRILIIGQAPGHKVHASGIPWDDASGKNLRRWLGVSAEQFYNPKIFALVPMGFCYPGTGKSGDLPPRTECAPLWHKKIIENMPHVELTLLFGQYAQHYYLGDKKKDTLTDTVKGFQEYLPRFLPMPHPSPRNGIWLRKNPWFEAEVLPYVASTVEAIKKGAKAP